MIESAFGPYVIEEELGQGTLSSSYRATDGRSGRRVVVKLLRPELRDNEGYWNRLSRDFSRLRALKHRHIAGLLDLFEDRGHRLVVQELVRGHTLLQEMDYRGGSLPLPRLYTVFRQILAAIGHAHSAGIRHLALNPNKIMMYRSGDEDRVKILDVGLGPVFDKGSDHPGHNPLKLNLEQAFYLSPEQLHKSMTVSDRSDLYSIGILLYEGATGYVPFGGDNLYDVIRGHLLERPETPANLVPDIPWYLSATILTAIAKHPDDRFDNAKDFGYHLIACQTGAVVTPTRRKVKVARVRAQVQRSSPAGGAAAADEPAKSNGAAAGPFAPDEQPDPARRDLPSPAPESSRVSVDQLVNRLSAPLSLDSALPGDQAKAAAAPSVPTERLEELEPDDDDTDPRMQAAEPLDDDERSQTPVEPIAAGRAQAELQPAIADERDGRRRRSQRSATGGRSSSRSKVGLRQVARLKGADSEAPPLLPRGIEPRDLEPLPDGVPTPSYLALLRVSDSEALPQRSDGPSSEPSVIVIGEVGIGRSGFKPLG